MIGPALLVGYYNPQAKHWMNTAKSGNMLLDYRGLSPPLKLSTHHMAMLMRENLCTYNYERAFRDGSKYL